MLKISRAAAIAAVAFAGLVVQAGGASALPMIDIAPAVVAHSEAASGITEARWHGPYGWHRHYGWHRPFGWHRHYGWHRPFGWHRHCGWHRGWYRHHWR